MDFREWALITFSILSQMAVGSFIVLGALHYMARRKAGDIEADRLSDRALIAIGPVLVLGILASFAHLGNPMNAPRAVANLGSSWLSREIFSVVVFAILGAVFTILQWRKIGSFALRNLIAWAAALVGLFLVFSMSQVYMLETQPSWNTLATPILFFATTFLLGCLTVGAGLVASYTYLKRRDPSCEEVQCGLVRDSVKGIAVVSALVLGIEIVAIPLQLAYLTSVGSPAAQASVAAMFSQYGLLFSLRLVFVFLGAGVLAIFLYRYASQPGKDRLMGNVVYGAFALVLIAEIMGRFLFYATQTRIGI